MNYRNGDWIFTSVNKVEGEAVKSSKEFVFGIGEATNHKHTLVVDDPLKMKWFKSPEGGWYVQLEEEARATHPEHSMKTDLKIAPGIYRVHQSREKDWFSLVTRRVVD